MSKRLSAARLKQLVRANGQLWLDCGCGHHKTPGAIGMDRRKVDGIDVVHDLEDLPYPFPANTFNRIILSHVMEHLNPKYHVDIMNELWRIMKPDGLLCIAQPHAGSDGHWQDPTHIKPWSFATPFYFDPAHQSNLYDVYRPSPWKIVGHSYNFSGNLEVAFTKRSLDEAAQILTTQQK